MAPKSRSGPGRFSKRVDVPKTPGLANSDLQSGDVGRLTDAQRVAPIAQGQGIPRPAPDQSQRPVGAPPRPGGGEIPPWLTGMPSARPAEPITAGMDQGPGPDASILSSQSTPPQDLRDATLLFLDASFGNQDARQMREEYHQTHLPPQAPPPAQGPLSTAPSLSQPDLAPNTGFAPPTTPSSPPEPTDPSQLLGPAPDVMPETPPPGAQGPRKPQGR